ncbi:MAG: RdgB/HAM1 family non-canonical purine NTP pyrophosphatase [Dehalococcoidia bacterium]
MTVRRLVVATGNAAKAAELRELLADSGWEIVSAADAGLGAVDVVEGGRSYLENATLKATAFARVAGMPALADDSGLEVDALDGRPGVFSARYGGAGLPSGYGLRMARLLDELRGVPRGRRTARFRAAIALALPGGRTFVREGVVEGRITEAPRGEGGFGYDPVFELPDGRTMAELGSEKATVSHRALAVREMIVVLNDLA